MPSVVLDCNRLCYSGLMPILYEPPIEPMPDGVTEASMEFAARNNIALVRGADLSRSSARLVRDSAISVDGAQQCSRGLRGVRHVAARDERCTLSHRQISEIHVAHRILREFERTLQQVNRGEIVLICRNAVFHRPGRRENQRAAALLDDLSPMMDHVCAALDVPHLRIRIPVDCGVERVG